MSMTDNFEAMLKRGQDNALLRYSLGTEYLKSGDFLSAIEHLQSAVAQEPTYSAAWKILGKAQLENEDAVAAIATWERGIKVDEEKGDIQAAKEMKVFLKRAKKSLQE